MKSRFEFDRKTDLGTESRRRSMSAGSRSLAATILMMGALILFAIGSWFLDADTAASQEETTPSRSMGELHATVVSSSIPGAGAICQIGTFHPGGPFHDKAAFALRTQPGVILDPTRLFVASSSNFGSPLVRPQEAPGAILSIDVSTGVVNVPPDFALSGGQASALGGAVQLYAAQSAAFLNSVNNPGAVTSGLPSVSLPLGISLNNGFGRPWIANAPGGSGADGTVTVDDPSGAPLAAAPDLVAGGVFSGTETNRSAASTQGITSGAVATALLGKSPDGSGRAVFAAALADGSVVQIHVAKGVDGLAPAGTFAPIGGITPQGAESADPGVVTRVGMLFNWVPTRNLFVTDPLNNRIVVLDLTDNGTLFAATARYLSTPFFDEPIDLAPATREVAAHNFASNTTLAGGSDMYVLNRGNNSIVRMSLNGDVRAVRQIEADLPGFRVNGVAVSSDGQTLWVTATAPHRQGVVLQLPAFGASPITSSLVAEARAGGATDVTAIGTDMFAHNFTPAQGLGPLFNGQSCDSCHSSPAPGGMGTGIGQNELRLGRINHEGKFMLLDGGAPARVHSIAELGIPCGLPTGVPPSANITSLRNAMTLRGNGLLDAIAERDILANQAAEPALTRGKPNLLADGRIGRFGWKADVATLDEFMGVAFRDEMGVTNPFAPRDVVEGCGGFSPNPEIDALPLQAVASFINTLDPPVPSAACLSSSGAAVFTAIGCANCHTPALNRPGAAAAGNKVQAYSDLLLHDMGPGLADGFQQGSALGSEFRTMPLWRVSERSKFLHDGRAVTLPDAVSAHGGQAAASRDAFLTLDPVNLQALLDFLGCI